MSKPCYDPRRPLDGLTRRSFLIGSGVVGGAALLAGGAAITWTDVAKAAQATPLPAGTPILVLLTLYGGNDGLNTLVPYADPAYATARPGLAYTADQVLRLDDHFGLNPGLAGFAKLWADRKLAIVRGVGYPKPDRSHFRSMDIWQTASPDRPVTTGWIGRWLDRTGAHPLAAIHLGSVLPPLAVGERHTAAALGTKPGHDPKLSQALADLSAIDSADTRAMAEVRASYRAFGSVRADVVDHLDDESLPTGDEVTDDGSLAGQLQLVARCIRIGAPTTAYSVTMGGFDTHADELTTQSELLRKLDEAVTKFRAALAAHPRERDVVVLAYSEFGRRVRANASDGTDHGTAGNAFLIGDLANPGFHGDPPSLTDLADGDLKTTTDFRSVYSEVIRKVLRADPAGIVNGPAELGVLR